MYLICSKRLDSCSEKKKQSRHNIVSGDYVYRIWRLIFCFFTGNSKREAGNTPGVRRAT